MKILNYVNWLTFLVLLEFVKTHVEIGDLIDFLYLFVYII